MADIFPEIPDRLFPSLPVYPPPPISSLPEPFTELKIPDPDIEYMNAIMASRGQIVESLNMKNQWRTDMLKKAPLQTFGGKISSKI